MLQRCFILRVHARGEPFNDTACAVGSPLLQMRMHMVLLELNTTLNSSEKCHKCVKEPGAPVQKASATRHHWYNLSKSRCDLSDNPV